MVGKGEVAHEWTVRIHVGRQIRTVTAILANFDSIAKAIRGSVLPVLRMKIDVAELRQYGQWGVSCEGLG